MVDRCRNKAAEKYTIYGGRGIKVCDRWLREQQRNRRNNLVLEFNGERLCVAEWAERIGLKQHTLAYRIRVGWSVERALSEPLAGKRA